MYLGPPLFHQQTGLLNPHRRLVICDNLVNPGFRLGPPLGTQPTYKSMGKDETSKMFEL